MRSQPWRKSLALVVWVVKAVADASCDLPAEGRRPPLASRFRKAPV